MTLSICYFSCACMCHWFFWWLWLNLMLYMEHGSMKVYLTISHEMIELLVLNNITYLSLFPFPFIPAGSSECIIYIQRWFKNNLDRTQWWKRSSRCCHWWMVSCKFLYVTIYNTILVLLLFFLLTSDVLVTMTSCGDCFFLVSYAMSDVMLLAVRKINIFKLSPWISFLQLPLSWFTCKLFH